MRFLLLSTLILATITETIAQNSKQCYERVYRVTDVLPTLSSSVQDVVAALENEILIPDSLRSRNGNVFIKCIINCHGTVVKPKLIKKGDWDGTIFYEPFEIFLPQIKKVIMQALKYNPAVQQGMPVDFEHVISVAFEDGRIYLSVEGR
jgi:hypothetical protein